MITLADAFIFIGLGNLWMGCLVFSNGGFPRQLRRGETPSAEKGTELAFMLFWMDQYCWFGLTLIASGLVLPVLGFLRVV